MTLQDIARKGYAHLYMDGPFRYRKEFAGIEKELRMLARERELYRNFPYKERMHDLRERSMAAAELLLKKGRDPQGYAIRSPKDGQVCGKDTGHGGMPGKGHDPPILR